MAGTDGGSLTLPPPAGVVVPDRRRVAALRRARRIRRLGDVEWFDIAYRVYLFALLGVTAVVVASDAIAGIVPDDVELAEILRHGPGIAGIAVAVAVAAGLRNGADGGPVAIEAADGRHLLLAPVGRRAALVVPTAQRLRAVAFALALPTAIGAQLVAREIAGSRAAWAGAGAMFGAVVGAAYVALAVLANGVRLPPVVASAIGWILVVWQSTSAWATWRGWSADEAGGVLSSGPFDLAGSLLFWGVRRRGVDVAVLVVVALLVGASLRWCGRLRHEALVRRAGLVSQLRFAATVQDIRTVVVLRRQLRAETLRSRPWGRRRADRRGAHGATAPDGSTVSSDRPAGRARGRPEAPTGALPDRGLVVARSVASLRRLPATRILRMLGLAVLGGISASLTITASAFFAVGVLLVVFVLGLEVVEPLAQEIDRPDRTDALPVDRGRLFLFLLAGPLLAMVGLGLVGAVAAAAVRPPHAGGAFALAVPVAIGGAIGAIASTVRDAPLPRATGDTNVFGRERVSGGGLDLPEFAGLHSVTTGLMPVLFSAVGVVPVLAMRAEPGADTVLRSAIGVALAAVLAGWWILRRDRWSVAVRRFFAAGRVAG